MTHTINRKYKDRLFCSIFKEKKEVLSLYNAINGTNYDNEDALTITTLDNAIYMTMKSKFQAWRKQSNEQSRNVLMRMC